MGGTNMAKLVEELVVIKLTKMVRDGESQSTALDDKQREVVAEAVPALVEELLNDKSILVELAELG